MELRSAPIDHFIDVLDGRLLHTLKSLGYGHLTPVQILSLNPILRGENVFIVAPTGSGKTEAAMIPILNKLLKEETPSMGIQILYMTPLRALNRDLLIRLQKLCNGVELTVGVWHGDTPYSQRKKLRENPPNMLITTSESLQILLANSSMIPHLSKVRYVIVDEAQEFISSERGAELAVALERLEAISRGRLQIIALSALIGDVSKSAQYIFGNRPYRVVEVPIPKTYRVVVDVLYEENADIRGSPDYHAVLGIDVLVKRLRDLLQRYRQGILFVNTRDTAEYLGLKLSEKLKDTTPIKVHHGSLSRDIRESIERDLKEGRLRLVVATSSLELGIDIGSMDFVVQYMSPRQVNRLVQRIGRSGHGLDLESRGYVYTPPLIQELLEAAVIGRRLLDQNYEELTSHIKPLDVLVHQIVGIALQFGCLDVDTLFNIITRAKPFHELSRQDLEKALEFANQVKLIKYENGRICSTTKGRIYYLTTSMIPDTRRILAKDILSGRIVGELDADFVVTCSIGEVIVLGGRLWRIVSIEDDYVVVEPVHIEETIKLPRWLGENIPVHYKVAREVCALLRRLCSGDRDKVLEILSKYPLSDNARKFILNNFDEVCKLYPKDNELVVEVLRTGEGVYIAIYSCLGSKASEAFANILTYLFREHMGIEVSARSTPIAVLLFIPINIELKLIKQIISRLVSYRDRLLELIHKSLKNSQLLKWRMVLVARKLGLIEKDVCLRDVSRYAHAFENTLVEEEALRELITERLELKPIEDLLNDLASRKKRVRIVLRSSPSRFLKEILSQLGVYTRLEAMAIPREVFIENLYRRYVERKDVRYFCLMCGYTWSRRLRDNIDITMLKTYLTQLKDLKPVCSRCGSTYITIVDNDEQLHVLKKALRFIKRKGRLEKFDFNDDEWKELERLRKISELVMDYGIAAVIALQGFGVGPDNAKRILSKAKTLEELLLNIYEQEKYFLRIRKFISK